MITTWRAATVAMAVTVVIVGVAVVLLGTQDGDGAPLAGTGWLASLAALLLCSVIAAAFGLAANAPAVRGPLLSVPPAVAVTVAAVASGLAFTAGIAIAYLVLAAATTIHTA